MSTLPDEDGLNWFEAALGWLLPGYGLIRLGHRRRGAWAMAAVLGLFASGLVIGGLDSVDRREDGLWFVMQAGTGPIAFAADWGNTRLIKTGHYGRLVETPPSRLIDRGAQPRVSTLKSITYSNEIGTLFSALAGLLNVSLVLDTLQRRRTEEAGS
jgi:hypothetical protein